MRPIDSLREKIDLWEKTTKDTAYMSVLHDVLKQIDVAIYEMDHQEAESPWHRVEEELPKLPDNDYCHIWCVGWFEGQKRSVPMEYGRILKRGKRAERWLLYDRISLPPTKWAYLPEPPKEGV